MRVISFRSNALLLLAALALPATAAVAQQQDSANSSIVVVGPPPPDFATLTRGPDLRGTIAARTGDALRVVAEDGTSTTVVVTPATRIRGGGGLFGGRGNHTAASLLNGLPVTVKTLQSGDGLYARQVNFRGGDLRTASMIRNGTAQQFAEQSAATEALRGRVGDIDNYNIRGTTNVYFDTGRWALSPQARDELCAAATQAGAMNNALLLVVGYTDSVGSEDYNQTLSERRAGAVLNHLQQGCRWQPWRVLTPTGMAESDPTADNTTPEGRAQNRRVAVNVLVSKAVDGM